MPGMCLLFVQGAQNWHERCVGGGAWKGGILMIWITGDTHGMVCEVSQMVFAFCVYAILKVI